jgi:glycosyltransferase involved in cell wall biosynthesis
LKWQVQKISLLGTKRIITDSRNSRNDIVKITGFLSDNIDVIHLAPSQIFQKETGQKEIAEVTGKYTLPQRYIVYVGDVNWNKNILRLLRAFNAVHQDKKYDDIKLVLVGKAFLNQTLVETQQIRHEINLLHVEKSVLFPGHVSDIELAGIYAGAVCCIQPSLYEGFGLPVLEAMACGTPVICSQSSSLPEIAGPSILVDPVSVDSIAIGVKTCLNLSEKERNSLTAQSTVWAAKFTWKRVARETVQTYERICI